MTSNERYAVCNERFDARAPQLAALGYTYGDLATLQVAVFTCRRKVDGKAKSIPAATLLYADDEVWADVLALATAVGDAPLPPPAPKISDQIIDSSSVLWIVKHVFDPLPTQPQAYVMLCWLGVP